MRTNNFNEKNDQAPDSAVKAFIEEYDRLMSALKKDFRKGKKLSCLSSLTAMKPLHSHLVETFVSKLDSDSPQSNDPEPQDDKSSSDEFFGYL
jgi:hypothetical protein